MSLISRNHSCRALFTIAGWGLFFAVLYVVATTKNTSTVYDPFAILDINPARHSTHLRRIALIYVPPERDREANKETLQEALPQIVRNYSHIHPVASNSSVYSHPDTVKLSEGRTIDDANEYFIKLTKAYKALTDEEVRRNFLEYGHPDGKQTVSIGLALPAWIIDSHNNIWVLGFYGILFGGFLPYFVVRTISTVCLDES